jgi:hypothetical protein
LDNLKEHKYTELVSIFTYLAILMGDPPHMPELATISGCQAFLEAKYKLENLASHRPRQEQSRLQTQHFKYAPGEAFYKACSKEKLIHNDRG